MSDTVATASTTPTPTPIPPAKPTQGTDWLAVQAQASDKSLADIYSMGVDPNTTTLQDKNFYKESPKIQSMFKQPNGQFDDKAFDQFYNGAAQSLNQYQKGGFDLGNVTMDLWNDTSLARSLGAPINKNPVKVSLTSSDPFTNLKTAQKSFFGLNEIGKWTQPKKSYGEVAEGQKVLDGATGKELDYTPEDTSLTGLFGFFGDPLVFSQYDEDVKDAQGKLLHKKGEMKLDDKGLPRYETLAGRDVAGKQVLSRWNTLTKEDSFANKLDFMDSDDIQKSIMGSLVKGAVELLPLALGGPISTAYQAYYIASNLLDATAQIGKSIDGIMDSDAKSGTFYKFANNLQGWFGQQKTDMSEYGKSNMFSLENLANQAVDAVLMMTAQNTVFTYPSKIRQYQMAKALGAAEGSPLKALLLTPEAESRLGDTVMDFDKYMEQYKNEKDAGEALLKNFDELKKYEKYSGYMATTYMAATMATGITQAAKAAGLNDRDTGMLYLGYMGALTGFFRMGVATWVHDGLKIDELAKDMNAKTIEYAAKYLPQDIEKAGAKIGAEAGKAAGDKGRGLQLLAAGRGMGKKMADFYTNKISHAKLHGFGIAAVAGGLEMGSMEALKSGVQGIYNSLQAHGLTSTKGDARFDLNGADVMSGIASSAFGGAFGGAIFHTLDKSQHETFKQDDLVSYVLNGYGSKLVDQIQDLQKKGQLGSQNLSISPLQDQGGAVIGWSPVNKQNPVSHNDFIADRMVKTIKAIDAMRRAYQVDPQATIEAKNKMYAAIVDTGTDTDLRDRIHATFSELYNTSLDLAKTPEIEGEEAATAVNDKRTKMVSLAETLLHLQGDSSLDEFFGQGLFNIRTDINNAFGVKNRDSMANEVNPIAKSFEHLTAEDKAKVEQMYQDYKNLDGPGGMKWDLIHGKEDYDAKMTVLADNGYLDRLELYKQSLEAMKEYTEIVKSTYRSGLGEPVSVMYDTTLQEAYLSKLAGVKYIPDRVYDDIKNRLTVMQSEGASTYLNILAPDIDGLKDATYTNLKRITPFFNNEHFSEFMKKKLGEKQFDELINSPEFKDIMDKGQGSSDYSLLKVLKGLSNFTENQEDVDLRTARAVVDDMLESDAQTLLDNFHNPDQGVALQYPELVNYMVKHKVGEYLDQLEKEGNHLGLLYDGTRVKDLFKNILLVNHIEKVTGRTMASHDKVDLIQEPALSDSLAVGLTVDGKYVKNGNVLHTNTLQHLETEPLDAAVLKAKEFNAQRVPSPLTEMLEATTEFLKDQYEDFNGGKVNAYGDDTRVNGANYLNASDAFADQLDGHINQVRRVSALVEASVSVNPLINDFRINNPAGLADDAKGERMFVISSEDASYLQSELGIMLNKLTHLREVNNYNKNNILAKLLKESGLDLASKYQTLKSIAAVPAVTALLPSLQNLYQLPSVDAYSNTYKTASEELRNQALYEMAKFEDAVYGDFQGLKATDKSVVVNSTFKPIDMNNIKFYQSADGEKPYNEYAQTIYLAKVYGSSTMDFYKRFAGDFDSATKLFQNLANLKHVPFSNQEAAVRMSHLLSKGDRMVVDRLFNAYATEFREDSVYDFDLASKGRDTFKTTSAQIVWGDPGTGKTTAVLLNAINVLDKGEKDVLLLAPEKTQVDKLISTLVDNGYENRIDNGNSKILREFMQGLELTVKGTTKPYSYTNNDGKVLLFDENEDAPSQFKSLVSDLFDSEKLSGLDTIKDGKTGGTYTLTDSLVNKLSRYKLIAVDEYTHINPIDLAMLHKVIDLYNDSSTVVNAPNKRITVLDMGDPNQMGYLHEGLSRNYTDLADAIISQPLTTSLRSGWDLVNNTLTDLRNRAIKYNHMSDGDLAKTQTLQESIQAPIRANYVEGGESGSLGIKVVNKTEATKEGDLAFITANKSKFTGGDLIYVVNTDAQIGAAEAMLRSTLGDNWNLFARVATPKQVQGGEYKYAIIDASPQFGGEESGSTKYNIRRVHTFLNTMLSRATEAVLYLKDSSVDPYVTFSSNKAIKAIQQIKLDQKTKDEIKADKQQLMGQILQDYTPKEGGAPVTETPASKEAKTITYTPADTVATLFREPKTEPRYIVGKSTDMISHNSYSTVKDFDTIFKMRYPDAMASDIDSDTIKKSLSRIINSYKYYLLHANRDGIGDAQVQLRSEFESLFEQHNLDWENPLFYLEIGKRGAEGITSGRSELTSDYPKDPEEIVVNLKLHIPHKEEGEGVDLTMGFLSNIDSLSTKVATDRSKDERAIFFNGIKNWINNNKTNGADSTPKHGETAGEPDNRVWRSGYFTSEEWANTAKVYGSRIIYDNAQAIKYQDFKSNFFDFTISEPQVVVANLIGDNNKSILDPDNANPTYADKGKVWDMLKGKAVAFVSDVYELNTKSPKELLDIYIKQLTYFGEGSDFQATDDRGKQRIIDELEDTILTPSNVSIRYRPGLVKLIKLDNPKQDFLNFRERFLQVVKEKSFRAKMTQELFKRFDTSLYVKDRLAKSLLTLKKFLDDNKKNRDWFEDNVISKWNKVSDEYVEDLYRRAELEWNNGEKLDRDTHPINEVNLERKGLAQMSLKSFRDLLDDLLDPNDDNSIFRGKYSTTNKDRAGNDKPNNVKVYKGDLDPNVGPADLMLKLTGDKNKDFAGSLIDIKMFNLLQKTRNANFAGTIDFGLKALAGFEDNAEFRKYNLSNVFKDGLIESVVIAQQPDDPNTDRDKNVLAGAFSFGGDFSFNLGKLTHPFYSIDFDQLTAKLEGKEIAKPEEPELPVKRGPAPKPTKVVELNDITSNTESGFELTVQDRLEDEAITALDHDHNFQLKIEPLTASIDKATYQVTTSDGSIYEMEYNMQDDTVKATPLKVEGDEKAKLVQFDKAAMKGYKDMVDKMFGDMELDPMVKQSLQMIEDKFRHTMVSTNMVQMNAKFSLSDYDANLASYRDQVEYDKYKDLVNNNLSLFAPYSDQFEHLSDYITNYTPNIC